jgi:hypothetical protein
MEKQKYCADSVVHSVMTKFIGRSNEGIKKYGVTLDLDDLDVGDWIVHAQEELMDANLHLEKLKIQMKSQINDVRKCICCQNKHSENNLSS